MQTLPWLSCAARGTSSSGGYRKYEDLWTSPYSALRTLPGFKAHMLETGLADYWRQTGDWGDVCRPVGDDDFECS